MNKIYDKYHKGKISHIHIKNETKLELEKIMIEFGEKLSYEGIIVKLIEFYKKNN
jgi:hypothetical protein